MVSVHGTQLSNPLMEAAWFSWQQENAWGRMGAFAVSTQTEENQNFTQRARASIIDLRSLTRWELQFMAPDLFGSLPWALLRTQRTCYLTAATISLCFKGNLAYPWQYAIPFTHHDGCSFFVPRLHYLLR